MAQRPESIPDHCLVLYVVKATPTSTTNTVKPLILMEELSIKHEVHVVVSTSKEEWFHEVNPHKMVPAMEATESRDGRRLNIWESTSCLTYLADAYDSDGHWKGADLWERSQVNNWLTLHTAGLGATGKYWLYFSAFHAEKIPAVIEKLASNIRIQYDILETQLARPGQEYIALPDRPTIADIANLPFVTEELALKAGLNLADWPHLLAWSRKMAARPAVQSAWAAVQTFGHDGS